jgi:uncharacterized protein YceH (UPF0502 family)
MYLGIAGQDRTPDLGAELTRRAARHSGALSRWSAADSALSLRDARDPGDYLDRYGKLLRQRYAVSTEPFAIPGKPGATGRLLRRIKGALWRLLRYQHDRMAFQQNALNELVISALDFQRASSQQAITALEQRIRSLEAEVAALKRKAGP